MPSMHFFKMLLSAESSKVQIFWEDHKILRNLPLTFDYSTIHIVKSKGEDFAKFCGLLRIYELYLITIVYPVHQMPTTNALIFYPPKSNSKSILILI